MGRTIRLLCDLDLAGVTANGLEAGWFLQYRAGRFSPGAAGGTKLRGSSASAKQASKMTDSPKVLRQMTEEATQIANFNPDTDINLRDPAVRKKFGVQTGYREAEAARAIAISMINEWLDQRVAKGIEFQRNDFEITLEARSIITGKQHTPVEWQARAHGTFNNGQLGGTGLQT